eukprot:8409515-Pyramimonas_sp.AAC.1
MWDLRSDAGWGRRCLRQKLQNLQATVNPRTARGAPSWDLTRSDSLAACSSAPGPGRTRRTS